MVKPLEIGSEPVVEEHELTSRLDPVYDQAISTLRWGILTVAVVFFASLIWIFAAGDSVQESVEPIEQIPGNLIDLEPRALLDLSFLILMFTPVVTVLRVGLAFRNIGDILYFRLSFVILAILAFSISLSLIR